MKSVPIALVTGLAVMVRAFAHADSLPAPSVDWAIFQLLPSPGLVVTKADGAAFAMRWELAPVLWSFGVRPEVTPWRVLVAEPMVRYGGSVELFVAGEYTGRGDFGDRWGVRSGARLYLPLVQHGENVALSIGASHLYAHGEHGMGIELGGYVLYGVLGLQLTYAPPLPVGESLTFTVSIRYF